MDTPSSSPLILISNDDGIQAPGLLRLLHVAQQYGEVAVVAPDSAQSGMGHAISVGKPLRIFRELLPGGVTGYAVNGTPADCVKIATGVILDRRPDLIVSGINHGANSSVSSIYSGTLSAAREGALQGIPAIGFSLCNYQHDADMRTAELVAAKLIGEALQQPLGPGQLLNVNVPDVPPEGLKGIRVTRQAAGRWVEEFDERIDPHGRKYYWLTGRFALMDGGEDTDEYALRQGYASVTPMMSDLTAHGELGQVAGWSLTL